jgi:enoyl-CoA hydratase
MTIPQHITITEPAPHIALITISRPDALNALNEALLRELHTATEQLSTRADLRVVVITGAGRAFVAGADIRAMTQMNNEQAVAFARLGHRTMSAIAALPVPVIAAVNGFALGGGLELALSCDLIYMAEKAKVGLPEVGLGLIPGFGGTQRLGRLIGAHAARELTYTARQVSAQEAHSLGLALAVYPQDTFMDEVLKVATTIASRGPRAVRAAKKLMETGRELALVDALEQEREGFSHLFFDEEPKEGMSAFLDKRTPSWSE